MADSIKIGPDGTASLAADTGLSFKLAKSKPEVVSVTASEPCPERPTLPIRTVEALTYGSTMGLATGVPLDSPPLDMTIVMRAYHNKFVPVITKAFETVGTVIGVDPGNFLAVSWSPAAPSYTETIGVVTMMCLTVDLIYSPPLPSEGYPPSVNPETFTVDWQEVITFIGNGGSANYGKVKYPNSFTLFYTLNVEIELVLTPRINLNGVIYELSPMLFHPVV